MLKNLFILACVLLLSNCTTPTSAFLGPIFTGAKTGSVYQASLSYGSNRIINKMREVTQNNFQEMNSLNSDLSTDDCIDTANISVESQCLEEVKSK